MNAAEAARRAAAFFLDHHLYRSHSTGEVGDPRWTRLHYPPYYSYDVLRGLVILARAGALPDPRADDALAPVEQKRRPAGR